MSITKEQVKNIYPPAEKLTDEQIDFYIGLADKLVKCCVPQPEGSLMMTAHLIYMDINQGGQGGVSGGNGPLKKVKDGPAEKEWSNISLSTVTSTLQMSPFGQNYLMLEDKYCPSVKFL